MNTIEDKFMERVFIMTEGQGCWLWMGKLTSSGRPTLTWGHYGEHRVNPARFILTQHSGPPPSDKHFALHTCDNGICVRPDHLYWGTKKDNARDMVARGRHHWDNDTFGLSGEGAHNARWTVSDVIEMRRLHWQEGESYNAIASRFGIPGQSGNVSRICTGTRWASVKEGLPNPKQATPTTTQTKLLLAAAIVENLRTALLQCASISY